jgi:hypothetical protein
VVPSRWVQHRWRRKEDGRPAYHAYMVKPYFPVYWTNAMTTTNVDVGTGTTTWRDMGDWSSARADPGASPGQRIPIYLGVTFILAMGLQQHEKHREAGAP